MKDNVEAERAPVTKVIAFVDRFIDVLFVESDSEVKTEIVPVLSVDVIVVFVIVVASSFDVIGSVNVELSVDKTSVAFCIECLDEEETVVFGNVIVIEVVVDLGVISVCPEYIVSLGTTSIEKNS